VKSHEELKVEMGQLEAQMAEAKKSERTEALKKVQDLFKEFGLTAGMLKGALAEDRRTK